MITPFTPDKNLPFKGKKNFVSVRFSYSKACFNSEKSTLEQVDDFLNDNTIFEDLVNDLEAKFNVNNMLNGQSASSGKLNNNFGQSTACGDSAIAQSSVFMNESSNVGSNIFKSGGNGSGKNLNFKFGSG
jgi:hypothetical protein